MSQDTNPEESPYDVIVIGGGPAGATAATYLTMDSRRVLLLEKSHFPRHVVGESLLPSMMPILEDFGLLEEVEALNFPRKTGGTFIWGKSDEPWDVFFSNNPFLPFPYAYHVDRAVFDEILLNHAKNVGATVREGVEVTGAVKDEDGRVCGVTWTDNAGQQQESRASFVVDASGRAAVLGRQVNKRVYDDQMRQVAFYTYYKDIVGPPELREGHVIIESCPRGWFWYIPMHGSALGDASVGLVTGREFKDEYAAMGKEAFFAKALEDAPYTQGMLGPRAEQVQPMRSIVDWAYTCTQAAGPGYFLAGDAAAFLDPMLSTGVSIAMLAGYSASVCIGTILDEPETEEGALSFYNGNYQHMYEVTRDFLHYFYACNGRADSDDIFWKARKTLQLDESVAASQAFCFLVNTIPANPHPALEKQIHMYMQFMDQLEHPVEALQCASGLKAKQSNVATQTSPAVHFDMNAIPMVNGTLDCSWKIDGETRRLKKVEGVAFDSERPIFSSTSSWLLGRNLHEVCSDSAAMMRLMDGSRSWNEITELLARTEGDACDDVRARLDPVIRELQAQGLVLHATHSASLKDSAPRFNGGVNSGKTRVVRSGANAS